MPWVGNPGLPSKMFPMKSKLRNLLLVGGILVLCAVLGRWQYLSSPPSNPYVDPNVVLVGTRYQEPTKRITLVTRNGQELFQSSDYENILGYGSSKDEVFAALGPPAYQFEYLMGDYYVWEESARYDWDLSGESGGDFLTIGFGYSDKVSTVVINREPPLDAEPFKPQAVGTSP